MPIQLGSLQMHPNKWRYVGLVSSVVGLVGYALSSSFKHLFGERNLLKIFLYAVASLIVCGMMLFARTCQISSSLVKAHAAFLVVMLTSLYSFLYDEFVTGKPDALSLISSGASALMSLSLSRQTYLVFDMGVFSFLLGFLTLQLMKIKLMLVLVAAAVCYVLILVTSYSDSQPETRTVRVQGHVAIDVDAENAGERGADNESVN